MAIQPEDYAIRLEVDYPENLDRLTTIFRLIWIIPISIITTLVSNLHWQTIGDAGETTSSFAGGLALATALMIVIRRKYPRWWFDFAREFIRLKIRVIAYLTLLTDQYPSTVDDQAVHLEIDYPDVTQDLNRWLPLVKWFLVIPHIIALLVLALISFLLVILAWFAIIFSGRYPRGMFDFVVGVIRWGLRIEAYALLLVTDQYPPFSLR